MTHKSYLSLVNVTGTLEGAMRRDTYLGLFIRRLLCLAQGFKSIEGFG